ncbi:stemmadenine O-acetyltransferase [Eucalyptus grandis]|uniref:stemmadenine O-acetyltransferase n=1 Tax=Eucalyptus grandis TaxID=71139 RepID=UPI00192EB65B|nr:stemmadenine O-acetyltransferase [Eucalyptus grandis]
MARLKAETANVGVQNPTRTEVVTALMCNSLTARMTKVSGLDKPVVFTNAVNLRRRAVPNFHDDSMGNYVWLPTILCPLEEKDYDGLPSLIGWLREAKRKIDGEFVRGLEGDGGLNALQDALGEMRESLARTDRLVTFSSWCNFGHYEIDFGWGRPAWVSPVGFPEESGNFIVNTVLLLDTRCRKGVEAWVFMDEQELEVLEQDEELTEYASINPPVSEIED